MANGNEQITMLKVGVSFKGHSRSLHWRQPIVGIGLPKNGTSMGRLRPYLLQMNGPGLASLYTVRMQGAANINGRVMLV